MSDVTTNYRFVVRRGTAAALAAANETPKAGEFYLATDTGVLKIGDGSTAYNALMPIPGRFADPGDDRLMIWDDSASAYALVTLSAVLDLVGSAADGDILIRSGGAWTRLAAGDEDDVLTMASGLPAWEVPTGGGGGSVNPLALSIYRKIVGWWERDEASGTVMTDAHINALHGTYSGLTVNQTGLAANLGTSVQWPSGNNYAEVADSPLFKPAFNMACMVWVKRNGTQGNFPKLMWKPGGSKASGQANFMLQQDNFGNGGKAMFRVTSTSGTNFDALTSSALADLTTYMLVGQRVNTEISIWRNGTKEGTNNLASGQPAAVATDALRFGYHGASGDPWIGWQDQAALFSDYLTADEIAYLYNSGSGISYATLKAAAGF